jgi:hypothetical protein
MLNGALTCNVFLAFGAVRTQHSIFDKCGLCNSFTTGPTFHDFTPHDTFGLALILPDIGRH